MTHKPDGTNKDWRFPVPYHIQTYLARGSRWSGLALIHEGCWVKVQRNAPFMLDMETRTESSLLPVRYIWLTLEGRLSGLSLKPGRRLRTGQKQTDSHLMGGIIKGGQCSCSETDPINCRSRQSRQAMKLVNRFRKGQKKNKNPYQLWCQGWGQEIPCYCSNTNLTGHRGNQDVCWT